MQQFADDNGVDTAGATNIMEMVAVLAKHYVKPFSEVALLTILKKRQQMLEADAEDMGKVVDLDYALDVLDPQELENV